MKKTYEKPTLIKIGTLPQVTAAGIHENGSNGGNGFGISPFKDFDFLSDRRLKTNISRIGTTVFGLPAYRFSYLGSDEMFTGVMAQDVLGVMPQAVSRDAAGFYRVNYGMLGIEMKRAA